MRSDVDMTRKRCIVCKNTVIGDRAFASTADDVYALASRFIEGMAQAGMSATAKHFPGHGFVAADSHLELPTDLRSREEIFEQDMAPFKRLIAQHKLSAVMPAHVVYPAVDAGSTAGFSPVWLQEILRKQLGFDGLIYSDDLSMEGAAASGSPAIRAEKAKAAGCNVLLICNNREAAQEIVNTVREKQWPLLNLHSMKAQISHEALYDSSQWHDSLANVADLLG